MEKKEWLFEKFLQILFNWTRSVRKKCFLKSDQTDSFSSLIDIKSLLNFIYTEL